MNILIDRIEKRIEYVREQRKRAEYRALIEDLDTEIATLERTINDFIWLQESKQDG